MSADPLRIKIVIRPSPSDDARLTVEDAMRQVLDALDVLNASKSHAIKPDEDSFVWRLEKASTNSPFTIEAVADPLRSNVDITAAVRKTKAEAIETLRGVTSGQSPPFWITRDASGALSRIAQRTMNGIGATLVDCFDFPAVEITRNDAPRMLEAVRASDPFVEISTPRRVAYGDIDGRLIAVGTHYRSPALFLLTAMYGRVPCMIPKHMVTSLGGEATLSDVWQGKPVVITGKLHYAPGGRLASVEASNLREKQFASVPLDQIIDADFTAGLEPPDYLDRLHEGDLG